MRLPRKPRGERSSTTHEHAAEVKSRIKGTLLTDLATLRDERAALVTRTNLVLDPLPLRDIVAKGFLRERFERAIKEGTARRTR